MLQFLRPGMMVQLPVVVLPWYEYADGYLWKATAGKLPVKHYGTPRQLTTFPVTELSKLQRQQVAMMQNQRLGAQAPVVALPMYPSARG